MVFYSPIFLELDVTHSPLKYHGEESNVYAGIFT